MKDKPKYIYNTRTESLKAYDISVKIHKENIEKSFDIFGKSFCETLKVDADRLKSLVMVHDNSKLVNQDEINGYIMNFFPHKDSNIPFDSYGLRRCIYEKALLQHYHTNPHHPEYWVMIKNNSLLPMPMEKIYICEMILDWIANSADEKDNVKDYWRLNRGRKLLHHDTIDTIDLLIDSINVADLEKLDLKSCLNINVDGV